MSGNVGIGITNPAYALDVNGSARIRGGLISTIVATTLYSSSGGGQQ